jgi:hypothetical protein
MCFSCHGAGRRGSAIDVESVFSKTSRHPIYETTQYHQPGEQLPEQFPSMPRHVACFDCHKAHLSDPEKPWRGSRGYAPGKMRSGVRGGPPSGLKLNEALDEYELCYLCHSDSANLPAGARNKGEEFDPTNASFHPVEMPGKNKSVPSLVRDLSVNSRIACGSCHGNSNPSEAGGPHGSDYAPLLIAEYRTQDGPEDANVYGLCYLCHDRRSIRDNESFKWHNLHVQLNDIACFSCHATHGSRDNLHLIDFSAARVGDRVRPANGIGPDYLPQFSGKPKCYLSCHNVDHLMEGVNGKTWDQLQAW